MDGKATLKFAIKVAKEILDALEKELMSKKKEKKKNVKKELPSVAARDNNRSRSNIQNNL